MKFYRLAIPIAFFFIAVAWLSIRNKGEKISKPPLQNIQKIEPSGKPENQKLKKKSAEAKAFLSQNDYNTKFCFMVDMSLPSGKNRFFIYDLLQDTVSHSGLVAHGNCYEYWLDGRKYSNVPGSGCTSLGKYKIGKPYTGRFGYSYKLHGLDSSNNNAFDRAVVLHSHSSIPDSEVPEEIWQSNGCPTVSTIFLEKLKGIINNSKKPVLLWIYE